MIIFDFYASAVTRRSRIVASAVDDLSKYRIAYRDDHRSNFPQSREVIFNFFSLQNVPKF